MTQSIVTPTASQRASAATYLERRDDWRYVRIAGIRYVTMESYRRDRVYRVRADGYGCSCPAYQNHGYAICSHMLAVRLGNDAEVAALAETRMRASYRDLFGSECAERGCTKDVERGQRYCRDHLTVDVF